MINSKYEYVFEKEKQRIISQNPANEKKYDCAGVYSISIGGNLTYIGKAKNMLKRITEHILEIKREKPMGHKYEIFKQAMNEDVKITFDVIYRAVSSDTDELEKEIGEKEGFFIRQYLPVLNYQIPKEENYKSFTVNKEANTITLDQIMEKEDYYGF